MKLARNTLLIFSLLVSLAGLILIYAAATNIQPSKVAISDISADMEGRKVSVIGYISDKQDHPNDHLFLEVSDNRSSIDVPLFSDYMKTLEQIGITKSDFHLKDKIAVEGIVQIYRGDLQIVPKNLNDVKIIGD